MNIMKPRSTVHNVPALLYKRFIGLEKSTTLGTVYLTTNTNNTESYWVFDKSEEKFNQVASPSGYKEVISVNFDDTFVYLDKKYQYADKWVVVPASDFNLLSLKFNDVGKYQTHKYYYAGSFDWLLKGGIEGITSQPIKGAIIPLDSLNIKHYNDDVQIQKDDLIVIMGKLFCVEDTEVTQKRMPRAYNVYSATLNNIL